MDFCFSCKRVDIWHLGCFKILIEIPGKKLVMAKNDKKDGVKNKTSICTFKDISFKYSKKFNNLFGKSKLFK